MRQARQTKAVWYDTYMAQCGCVEDGWRMSTACRARVLQQWTGRLYMGFHLIFQH